MRDEGGLRHLTDLTDLTDLNFLRAGLFDQEDLTTN